MALTAGARLGVYEVTSAIGEGGMGQVWLATDTTLNRSVAIKILPDAFAADPERLARFEREAKTLAALNHPHIASIYGFERSSGTHALVMEFVDGEDLSQRIARGAIPIAEALPIARQIAEALEAAHARGIIHRDLKPANIKLRADGTVKVLDFGLAKAIDQGSGIGDQGSGGVSNSPTITSPAMTMRGVILGTAAYMSPEQAAGKSVDQRSDLWAFGVVLLEMLTGRFVFEGETVTHVLAAVLTKDPDWSRLPAGTPPAVRRLLTRCLAKNPSQRLDSASVARLELDEHEAPLVEVAAPSKWRLLPWGLAALLALTTGAAVLMPRPTPSASRERLQIDIGNPAGIEIQPSFAQSFSLSPDGTRLAFVGIRDGLRRLFVRDVAGPEMVEIPGSTGLNNVTFSPDGTALAFVGGSSNLATYQFGDSAVRTVAATADATGGITWGSAGIVYQSSSQLWLIAAQAGTARQLTTLDAARGEVLHAAPTWLDDRVLAFASITNQSGTERIEAVTLDPQPRRVTLVERARRAEWSPTGHLLFDRDGVLMAVPFDLDTLKPTGSPSVVLPAETASPNTYGGLAIDVSRGGTLAYSPINYGKRRIVIMNRDGSSRPLDQLPGRYTNPRFSPDGTRLAVDENMMSEAIIDLARGTKIAVHEPAPGSGFATWNSDGTRLVFRRFNRPYSTSTDGQREGGPVNNSEATDYTASAGPTPDEFFGVRITQDLGGDIYLFSLSGKYEPKPVITGRGYQGGPQLSPDKRWLLYQSDETGRPEIYVRAYPVLDRSWQVSVGGGMQARWGAGGREVLYRSGGPMSAVPFDGREPVPVLGKPEVLFDQMFDYGQGISIANYDVAPNGTIALLRAEPGGTPFRVIRNWTDSLKP